VPTEVVEFHGFAPLSAESVSFASKRWCPFVDKKCKKSQSGGACVLQAPKSVPVIICPNRLYGRNFFVIERIAKDCFGPTCELITDKEAELRRSGSKLTGEEVVVFGQGFSGEVGISAPSADGESTSFKVDFLLCRVDADLKPTAIVAIEVQTIDTTNSYSETTKALYAGSHHSSDWGLNHTNAGYNWENVTKRILPQIIYKGHALRREKLATNGLFFVLPEPVFQKILTRVGGSLLEYPKGPGTVTFHSYKLDDNWTTPERPIVPVTEFTTTVEQIAFAFVSPQNLPDMGIYEATLTEKLELLRKAKRKKK
jgi:Restriction endonuclease NotI